MGNICRSPTAEAVFRARVEQAGLSQCITTDSAGTHNYHIGDPPDLRAQQAAKLRGYEMNSLRGRQIEVADFERFDFILAMDQANLSILHRLRPRDAASHLELFLDYSKQYDESEVPDPYYGGAEGFEYVLDLVEDAAEGLLEHIRKSHF
jgi:protein-tyrosine phosphatase